MSSWMTRNGPRPENMRRGRQVKPCGWPLKPRAGSGRQPRGPCAGGHGILPWGNHGAWGKPWENHGEKNMALLKIHGIPIIWNMLLVGGDWNTFYFSIYWGCHHPSWNHQPDVEFCHCAHVPLIDLAKHWSWARSPSEISEESRESLDGWTWRDFMWNEMSLNCHDMSCMPGYVWYQMWSFVIMMWWCNPFFSPTSIFLSIIFQSHRKRKLLDPKTP